MLDESNRKATRLERAAFAVDFYSYELGIVDAIAQIMLPVAGSRVGSTGVRAELYKLDV